MTRASFKFRQIRKNWRILRLDHRELEINPYC
jgi:hypothetical protein